MSWLSIDLNEFDILSLAMIVHVYISLLALVCIVIGYGSPYLYNVCYGKRIIYNQMDIIRKPSTLATLFISSSIFLQTNTRAFTGVLLFFLCMDIF